MISSIVSMLCNVSFLCILTFSSIVYDVIEKLEPEEKILSLAIKSHGRPDMVLPIPENGKPKGLWFTLKEGSKYSLQFTFQVSNNIVSGLKYTNMVWKTGVKGNSSFSFSVVHMEELYPLMLTIGFDILHHELLYQLIARKR